MKLKNSFSAMVAGLTLVGAVQAQQVTSLEWGFDTAVNPFVTQPQDNPSGAWATNSIVGDFNKYYYGMGPLGMYGTQSGLWSISNGQLDLELNRICVSMADFTVVLRQFVDNGAFYPGLVTFSIPGAVPVGRTIVEPQTGEMVGVWVEDTYRWTQLPGGTKVKLTIAPAAEGNGRLFVDAVELQVSGTIANTPEPASSQMVLMGLLALGARVWARRKTS